MSIIPESANRIQEDSPALSFSPKTPDSVIFQREISAFPFIFKKMSNVLLNFICYNIKNMSRKNERM